MAAVGGVGRWVVSGRREDGGVFFLMGIDLSEIVPKTKSNPASCRSPPLGGRAGPSLALGLTIQMIVFLTLRK